MLSQLTCHLFIFHFFLFFTAMELTLILSRRLCCQQLYLFATSPQNPYQHIKCEGTKHFKTQTHLSLHSISFLYYQDGRVQSMTPQ